MDKFTDFTIDKQNKPNTNPIAWDLAFTEEAPKYAWKWYFGNSSAFVVYTNSPPNRFQRWMITLFFGITWERVKHNEH